MDSRADHRQPLTGSTHETSTVAVAFQQGRAVVVAIVQRSGAPDRADVSSLARREEVLLGRTLPGLSLAQVPVPVAASAAYWGAVAGVAIAVATAPELARRLRTRKARTYAERLRRERMARGRKVVTRRKRGR